MSEAIKNLAVEVADASLLQRGRFELWEYKADVTGFVPGASFTLKCCRDQHEVCERCEAEFWPPQPD